MQRIAGRPGRRCRVADHRLAGPDIVSEDARDARGTTACHPVEERGPQPVHGLGESGFGSAELRNRKGRAVDLRTDAGVGAVRGMMQRADVVVETFRPGVMRISDSMTNPFTEWKSGGGLLPCLRVRAIRSLKDRPGANGVILMSSPGEPAPGPRNTHPRSGHGHRIPGHDSCSAPRTRHATAEADGIWTSASSTRRRCRSGSDTRPTPRPAATPRGTGARPLHGAERGLPHQGRLDHGRGVRHGSWPCGGRTSRCGR
ncbi:CoA transferase [Streptomyces sp. NPDC048584]|uniref:CoA transferase n=1 Tax=Streptomyces sp. NPDC048584 TaxID=3365573 RepID=UPI00371FD2AB